jgi:hypothetical protein
VTTPQYRTVPTYEQPLVVGNNTSSAWYRYLQQSELGTPPAAENAVTPTGSPYTYTAPRKGFLIVQGGTVSAIAFSRSGTFYNVGQTSGTFTLDQNDQLQITYSVAPTLIWVPT